MARWGPSIQRAELDDVGRCSWARADRVWTPFGVALPFEITEFEEGRRWAWDVAGIGATRHEVAPSQDGSRVAFGVPWWAPAYLPVCAIALRRIDRMTR